MKINLKLLTLIVVASSFFLPKELSFLLALGFIIFYAPTNKALIKKSVSTILWPIILLLLIGAFWGLSNLKQDWFRDIFLVMKIIIYFILGILLSKSIRGIGTFYKYFGAMATIYAIVHIVTFVLFFSTASTLDELRNETGLSNYVEAIYLAVILARLFSKSFDKCFHPDLKVSKIQICILIISFTLYFSRTMIVSTLIVLLFLVDFVNVRQLFLKSNKRFVIALIVSFVVILTVASIGIRNDNGNSPVGSLIQKFENIPNEVLWDASKNRYATWGEININWRGYESYQGIKKFAQGDAVEKIFGYGWGSLVDLGVTMDLGGTEFDRIPVLHNGYVMLLVKTGFIGIFLYLLFLYKIGGVKKYTLYNKSEEHFINQILSAISLMTLINTFTVSGLLNAHEALLPILFGLFWGMLQRKQKIEKLKLLYLFALDGNKLKA